MVSEISSAGNLLSFLVEKGGWVVSLLLLLSAVGWGIIFEKVFLVFWGLFTGARRRGELLRSHLFLLNLLSEVAPMLGLFGTVLGLVKSFRVLAENGEYPPVERLAGGMWVALLTTLVGLAVAIPFYFFYALFEELGKRWEGENGSHH